MHEYHAKITKPEAARAYGRCFLLLLFLASITSLSNADRPFCASCDGAANFPCNHYKFCYSDQKCATANYTTAYGQQNIWRGCVDDVNCNVRGAVSVKESNNGQTATCCDHAGCNGQKGNQSRFMCIQCVSTSDINLCTSNARLCYSHNWCYYHKFANDQGRVMYELGCKDEKVCNHINNNNFLHGKRAFSISSSSAHCCKGDFCTLHNVTNELAAASLTTSTPGPSTSTNPATTSRTTTTPSPTTTTPSPTTTTPSTTTTTPSPTTTTPSPTTTTPSPTTTTPSTTTTTTTLKPIVPQISQTQCYVGDGASGQPLLIFCTGATPYCMTNLTNYFNGYRETHKGCATEQQCYWLPYMSKAATHTCDSYDEDRLYQKDFDCSYCCTQDLCNSRIVPPVETLYQAKSGYIPPVITKRTSGKDTSRSLLDIPCDNSLGLARCLELNCEHQNHLASIYCRKHCNLC